MICRALRAFTDKSTGRSYRTGDRFECTEAQLAAIRRAGHYAEPIDAEYDDDVWQRFEAMSEDDLRLYADRHFKLTFHIGVEKPEMIAAIIERERG